MPNIKNLGTRIIVFLCNICEKSVSNKDDRHGYIRPGVRNGYI